MSNLAQLQNSGYLTSQIRDRYNTTGIGDPEGLEKLNSGGNRTVYKIIDDTYGTAVIEMVIKVQHPQSTENKMELDIWNKYRETKYSKYLVPIEDYSENYEWILMPYGESVPDGLVDTELYNLLYDLGGSDISKDDFVYMDGNASNQRCCDYATLD